MAGPDKVKRESRHHKKKNCSARKKGVAGKKARALGPGSHRKYLQDDELVDYALGHSNLFYPCLALSEFVN